MQLLMPPLVALHVVFTLQFRQKQEWILEETDKRYFLWIQSQFVEKKCHHSKDTT